MKNFKIYCACALGLFLIGCQEDSREDFSPNLSASSELQINSINDQGKISNHDPVDFMAGLSQGGMNLMVNPNQIVNGNFRTDAGSKYNLANVQNEDGISGDWQINSATLGHVYLQSVCVSVDGSNATIAAIVTEVVTPGVLQENYIVFLNVKDNGEGANAAPDQVSTSILYYFNWFNFYSSVEDFLADFPCGVVGTSPLFGPLLDRVGQIQVM